MPSRSAVSAMMMAAVGVVLLVTAPPAPALHTLRRAGSAPDATAPVVALAALTAWALLGWLLALAAAMLAGRLPGLVGRAGTATADRIAPLAVRRLVGTVLGVGVALGTVGASPAAAGPAVPPLPPASVSVSLDWPTSTPTSTPRSTTPTPPPTPALPAAAPALDWNPRPARPPAVVVATGNSLWSIAAEHLPSTATPAQVAQAWPAWWTANRSAIGDHPDLIHPGLRLDPPPSR